jgi:thiol-disulfide isomerase/thioredoxin
MSDTKSKTKISPTMAAVIFFIILDSVAFYGAYLNHHAHYAPISLSAPAPNFAWHAFDGSTHNLKELNGHVVVLHFWASWCPPCREEFPKLLKLANDEKDIMFLTVSSDDNLEKPQAFVSRIPDIANVKLTPNVLYAWDQTRMITYDLFMTTTYPETIIIDPTGRQRRKFPAPVDWDNKEVRSYLQELKEGK